MDQNSSDASKQLNFLSFPIIAVSCAILFIPLAVRVLFNDLIWDDELLITNFAGINKQGNLFELLTSPFWDNSSKIDVSTIQLWRPLTTFSIWLFGQLFNNHIAGYHALPLFGLLFATWSLYAVIRSTQSVPSRAVACLFAWLFVFHPLNAELLSLVANISDYLVIGFSGICLATHIKIFQGREPRFASLVIILCTAAALLSKELGVIALLSAPLAWFLSRGSMPTPGIKKLFSPTVLLPTLLPLFAYAGLRVMVIGVDFSLGQISPSIVDYAKLFYLGMGQMLKSIFIPIPLGVNRYVSMDSFAPHLWSVLTICIGLFLFYSAIIRKWAPARTPLLGYLLTIGLLLPSLSSIGYTFDTAIQFPARYFYPPLAGVLISLAPGFARLHQKSQLLLGISLCLFLALISFTRLSQWSTSYSFAVAEYSYNPKQPLEAQLAFTAFQKSGQKDNATQLIIEFEKHALQDDRYAQALISYWKSEQAIEIQNWNLASIHLSNSLKQMPHNLVFVLQLAEVRYWAGFPEQSVIILEKAEQASWFQKHQIQKIRKTKERYLLQAQQKQNSLNI